VEPASGIVFFVLGLLLLLLSELATEALANRSAATRDEHRIVCWVWQQSQDSDDGVRKAGQDEKGREATYQILQNKSPSFLHWGFLVA